MGGNRGHVIGDALLSLGMGSQGHERCLSRVAPTLAVPPFQSSDNAAAAMRGGALALQEIDQLFSYLAAQIPRRRCAAGAHKRAQLDRGFSAIAHLQIDDLAVP